MITTTHIEKTCNKPNPGGKSTFLARCYSFHKIHDFFFPWSFGEIRIYSALSWRNSFFFFFLEIDWRNSFFHWTAGKICYLTKFATSSLDHLSKFVTFFRTGLTKFAIFFWFITYFTQFVIFLCKTNHWNLWVSFSD